MPRLVLFLTLYIVPAFAKSDTVAFWRFNEKPAGTAVDGRSVAIRDASGFGNHGRLLGFGKYASGSGLDGRAIALDGQGLVEVPDAHVFEFQDDRCCSSVHRRNSPSHHHDVTKNLAKSG